MTVDLPLICVVMPAYRSADRLPRAATSVLSQRYERLLLAVAVQPDDKETIEAAERQGDPRVRIIHSTGRGIAAARNEAIRAITADYCMFLDSDDEYANPDVISAYVEDVRRAPAPALRFADWIGVSDGGVPGHACIASRWRPSFARLLLDNFVATGTVMLPRDLLLAVGGFDENYGHAEDWDLWLRVARDYPVRHVPVLALRYRETKLARPYPRSHFVSEMEIVRSQPQPVSRAVRLAALATAHGRHGLYYIRTLSRRRSVAALLALHPLDLLCIPPLVAYKLWRVVAGMRRTRAVAEAKPQTMGGIA